MFPFTSTAGDGEPEVSADDAGDGGGATKATAGCGAWRVLWNKPLEPAALAAPASGDASAMRCGWPWGRKHASFALTRDHHRVVFCMPSFQRSRSKQTTPSEHTLF